jgi:hypothetical protein
MTKEEAILHLIQKFPLEQHFDQHNFTDSLALQTLDLSLPLEHEIIKNSKRELYMNLNLKIVHDFMVHHYGIDIEPVIEITSQLSRVIAEFFDPYADPTETQEALNQAVGFTVQGLDPIIRAIASYWLTYTLQNWHQLKFFETKEEEELHSSIQEAGVDAAGNLKYADDLKGIKSNYQKEVHAARVKHNKRILSLHARILKETAN